MRFAVDKETGYILPEANFAPNHRIEDGKYKRLDPGKQEYALDLMELDVTNEDVPFVKLVDVELVVDRGEYEANINRARIDELKTMLTGSDYQAIKFAEGQMSEAEYALIRSQRQAWRDEINALESNNTLSSD